MAYRGTIETLGDLRDHNMGLFAHCTRPNAGHGGNLDIELLIARLGEGHVYINDCRIAAACVCRKCGWRGAELRVTVGARNVVILPVREAPVAGARPGVPNPKPAPA